MTFQTILSPRKVEGRTIEECKLRVVYTIPGLGHQQEQAILNMPRDREGELLLDIGNCTKPRSWPDGAFVAEQRHLLRKKLKTYHKKLKSKHVKQVHWIPILSAIRHQLCISTFWFNWLWFICIFFDFAFWIFSLSKRFWLHISLAKRKKKLVKTKKGCYIWN